MKQCFKAWKGYVNSFFAFWSSKKATWTKFLVMLWVGECSWELIICLLDVSKKDWWSWWSFVSSCRKAIENHFLHPRYRNKRLGRISLSKVLKRRMVLRTHNLLYGRLKKRLCWSRWSDVLRCRRAMRTPCLLPGHPKKRLGYSRLSDF
jgi:hypothetical protein